MSGEEEPYPSRPAASTHPESPAPSAKGPFLFYFFSRRPQSLSMSNSPSSIMTPT
ncbi:hypothetical protein BJX99DRAFT_220598 [Aspergillus californicus]